MAEFREVLAHLIATAVTERSEHLPPGESTEHVNGHFWGPVGGLCQLVTLPKVSDPRVLRTLTHLDHAWQSHDPLCDIASRVGLSPSRLSHLFKRDVGMPMRQLVLAMKLAGAVALLLRTDRRVSEICQDIGICDPSNLNHLFRKYLGTAPSDLRRHQAHERIVETVKAVFIAGAAKE